ncbi:hypothetical protein KBX10_04610 [Corynebacterium sp. CCUG 59401]|nr:hypothetical protein [Corynebacterium pseudogenitalium]
MFTVLIEGAYERPKGSTEEFDVFLDRVLDEFYEIGVEADYLADMETLRAEWTITVGSKGLDALIEASTALRTALHASKCSTHDWVSRDELKAIAANESELSVAS